MRHQEIAEAMTPQVTADATMHQVVGVIAKTILPPLYALIEGTAAGREAPLAPPLAAVVATTLLALDHPLAALDLRPHHHGAVARPVAPLLLVAVLEDADSRHF